MERKITNSSIIGKSGIDEFLLDWYEGEVWHRMSQELSNMKSPTPKRIAQKFLEVSMEREGWKTYIINLIAGLIAHDGKFLKLLNDNKCLPLEKHVESVLKDIQERKPSSFLPCGADKPCCACDDDDFEPCRERKFKRQELVVMDDDLEL